MADRYFVNIETIEPSGVVLTIEALPRLLIFGDTAEHALRWAGEAIGFYLPETSHIGVRQRFLHFGAICDAAEVGSVVRSGACGERLSPLG